MGNSCLNCNSKIPNNKKFCRSKGRNNCKDNYHNRKNPERLERVGKYSVDDSVMAPEMDCEIAECNFCGYCVTDCVCGDSLHF